MIASGIIRKPGEQRRIDVMLRWGIVFSFFWFGGIGSIYALGAGWKARQLIRESGNSLRGGLRAQWCMILGGIGSVLCLAIISIGLFNNLKSAF
ncbi:MAG TPA: hypothetical protein VHY56_00345 [Candidatus Binataceae bacterium]|nr:hypothetical protein [Candidatus Binataceae bacterium]